MAHRGIQFLAALLATLASVGYARAPAQIRHGEKASIIDFPYQVALYWQVGYVGHYCGGTIIDARHILTAACCVYSGEFSLIPPEAFEVNTASDNLDNQLPENLFRVLEVIPHPDYKSVDETQDDIAILRLNRPMSFNKVRKPAGLPTENISEGTEAMVTGWEYSVINYGGARDPDLQKLKVTVSNSTECSLKEELKPGSFKICVLPKGSGGAYCFGTGYPLNFNGTVIGVVSKDRCADGHQMAFTSVYSYLPWIKSIIKK